MGEDPGAIRAEIEDTRERMGDTVDALAYKADVKTRAKESVSDKVDTLKSKVTGAKDSVADATPGTGMLPSYYKSFYEVPEQTYPTDVELANQMLDDAGWESNGDEPRTKGDQELS